MYELSKIVNNAIYEVVEELRRYLWVGLTKIIIPQKLYQQLQSISRGFSLSNLSVLILRRTSIDRYAYKLRWFENYV